MLRVGVAQASSNETIRRWNPAGASIRDRLDSGFDIPIRNTFHIMDLARRGRLPDKIMINTHPQRWEDRALPWMRELVWQNVKNVVKIILNPETKGVFDDLKTKDTADNV